MSNRQERRARARGEGRPVAMRAEVLTSTGETVELDTLRAMPAKRPGHHRWQAFVVHALSEEQAEALADGGGKVLFDGSSVVMMPVPYCVDCERPFVECRGVPCPAGDEWRDE